MTAPPLSHAAVPPSHVLRACGWSAALAALFLKVIASYDPFPYWGSDATRAVVPVSALTPAGSMLADAIILIGCGVALFGESLAGRRISLLGLVLWAIGAVSAAAHAFIIRGGSLDDAVTALSWSGALGAGLTAFHLCRDPQLRRLTLAAAYGLLGMLIAKGLLQIWVEHPATVENFRANREAFLAAEGWAPDSPAARGFERRLLQAEATGWFGMANVYGSFCAAALTVMLGWAIQAWQATRRGEMPSGWPGALSIGAVAAAAGIWMAGSKGGVAAAVLGMILLGVPWASRRLTRADAPAVSAGPSRAAGLLALLLILAVLLAVIARGLVGERLSERSLLFRWHYLQGATRILTQHPLLGVGPSGFKDAYLLAKPPQSPEDVASPHSVLFDYLATLGLPALAWCALWLSWVYRAGRRLGAGAGAAEQASPADTLPRRAELWLLFLLILAPAIAAAWVERTLVSPDIALARLCGIAAWLGLSFAVLAVARACARWSWVPAAAALALAAHSQIELTAVWPGAAGLCMLLLAGPGAPAAPEPSATERTSGRFAGILAAVLLIGSGIAAVPLAVLPVRAWESHLGAAAAAVRPVAEAHTALGDALSLRGVEADRALDRLAADLAQRLSIPPPRSPADFERALASALILCAPGADHELFEAVRLFPSHFSTFEALIRLDLAQAAAFAAQPDGARDRLGSLVRVPEGNAEAFAREHPSAASWGLAGNTHAAVADLLRDGEYTRQAAEAWEHAAALDPYGPTFALKLVDAYVALGNRERARSWAQETLRRDQLQRLDPLRRLTPQELRRVEAALRG